MGTQKLQKPQTQPAPPPPPYTHAVILQKHDSLNVVDCLFTEQRLLSASLCDGCNYQRSPSLHMVFSFHLLQHWETVKEMRGTEVEVTRAPALLSQPLWLPYKTWYCRF